MLRCFVSHLCRKHPAHPQSYRKRTSLNSGSSAPRARPVLRNLLHFWPEALLHMPRQHLPRREVGRERCEVAGNGIKRSALVERASSRVGRILREHGCVVARRKRSGNMAATSRPPPCAALSRGLVHPANCRSAACCLRQTERMNAPPRRARRSQEVHFVAKYGEPLTSGSYHVGFRRWSPRTRLTSGGRRHGVYPFTMSFLT